MKKKFMAQKSDAIFAGLGFLLLATVGIFEASKGTMIPEIKMQFAVDYSSMSIMMMLGSISYIIMVFLGGILSDLKGQKFVILIGCVMTVSSLLLIQFANSFSAVCVLFFTLYLGLGCFEVASSLVARLKTKYKAIIMGMLHFFYGAGTIIGPFFATNIILNGGSWEQAFSLISIPLLVCLIIAAIVPFKKMPLKAETFSVKGIKWDKKLWIFIAILGLSLILEFVMINWFVNYLQQGWGVGVEQSSVLMTFFFVAFALGRIVGGFITYKIGYYKTLLVMGIAMAAIFFTGIMLGSLGVPCFIVFGFFMSIIAPTIFTGLMDEYKQKTASIMGIVMSIASAFNVAATWLMGKLNDNTNVIFGFNTLIIYVIAILVLLFVLGSHNRKMKEISGES